MNKVAFGRSAEDIAVEHVRRAGFTVLWRNLRLGAQEIDLVAQRGDLVALIEVRFRGATALTGPLASVTRAKRRFLVQAARRLWRERLRQMREVRRVRIDVIAITATTVEWIEGAFTADDT